MATITTPPVLMVSWSCKRCGHTGGTARMTFPVRFEDEGVRAITMRLLRTKLVTVHRRGQGCAALPDDFVIGRYVP